MSDHSNDPGAGGRAAIDRLNCPSCGVGFAVPKELDKFKGKKSRCQVCSAAFRFSADGLSLIAIDDASSLGPVAAPGQTYDLAASGGAPRPDRAPKPEPKPAGPRRDPIADIDLGEDPPIRDEPEAKKPFPLPWAIAAVAIAVAVLLPISWMAFNSGPKQGTIQVNLESPAAGVTISIDGKSYDLEQLKAPLTLPVGPHRLEAEGKGLVGFQGTLPVFEGANPPFPVKLTAVPEPAEVAVATTEEAKTEATAEPEPVAANATADDAQPAVAAATAEGAMEGADKVEADAPVVADLVFDDPADKGKPKANANATLKQIVGDPGSYLDTTVVPSDLVMVDTKLAPRPGPAKGLTVQGSGGAYQKFIKPGTPFEIIIKPEVAEVLRDQVRSRNLVAGDYPAIVKFQVVKDPKDENGFLGVVEWVELLVYVDPRPISKGNSRYNAAFTAIKIAAGGPQLGFSPNYKEWQRRLAKTNFLTKLKNAYGQAFSVDRGRQFDLWAELVKRKLPDNSNVLHKNMMSMFH